MNGNGKQNAESQLQVAIGILLLSVTDKSVMVAETVKKSLKKLAEKHPNQVLNSCIHFCEKKDKLNGDHVAAILRIMETICVENIINIDGDTILATILFSSGVMVENPGYDPNIQLPASGILVALGREHYTEVMNSLLKRLEDGVVPHYMVPHTLGAFANANPYGVVPYLKNVLSILLPLIGTTKSDILRQAFSYAIGSFCDALTEYCSNQNEQVPDSTIAMDNFNVEIGMAYDVLFTNWLQSRDPKVIESVLNAIASIYPVLSVDKVTQQTPKVIQVLLNLYKKPIDSYNITKCLGAVVQKVATVNGTILEPLMGNILHCLNDLVCISPDYAQPDLLRAHSEVLRCYECFALHFTDSTVDQLVVQLRNNNEKERVKALIVLTHLVSYSGEHTISRKYKDVLRMLNDLLPDPSIRVKKVLLKIIVAFAVKRVLMNKECNADGPTKYMEFILKMCCKQQVPKNTDVTAQELSDIQKSADNTLYMLSTSVPELENILWVLLMQCFLGPAYDDAVVTLLRCLTHLASKKESVGSCEAAFIRCLGLLADPLPAFRGTFILNFLRNVKPCDLDGYKQVWEQKLPQLVKYLEQNYDNFNTVGWHYLLFDFLALLLEGLKNQSFTEILVFQCRKQLDIYNNNRFVGDGNSKQLEKQFLLKCLAITLCSLQDKETVVLTLENILLQIKLTDYKELHVCAEAVGIISRSHLKIVLDKLAQLRRDVLLKKSSKFFSFMKDQKHDLDIERLRYVVIDSYAEICNEAPPEKLLSVIEGEILDYVLLELNNARDFPIRKACFKAISSVADAMHPNRNQLHIRLQEREKVMDAVASQIQLHNGPEYVELFPLIISAITSLARLPLPLESEDRLKLLKLFFDNVFNASAIYCKINDVDNYSTNYFYYGDLKMVPFIVRSFNELNLLVQELMLQSLSPATLDEIATLLEPWLARKKAEQRQPACDTLRLVLQTYLQNMKFAYDCPSTFGQTGGLLAHIVPRCTDPNKNIRKISVECVCLVLCIAARYEGHMKDHDKVLSNSLQHILTQIEMDEPKLLYNLTCDLAHVICVNMPQFQLIHFVDGLIDALLDCESSSSNGSGVVLSMTLKSKGSELQSQVANILEKMLKQLGKIQCARTRSSTLRSVLNLATHHAKMVGGILLAQPLPYDSCITDSWNMLSTDQTLVLDLLDQLKKIIKQAPMCEEVKEIKVVNLQSLQAVSALFELLKNGQLKDICIQQFPEIFSLLLVCLASYLGATAPATQPQSGQKKEKYGFVLNREAYKLSPTKIAMDTMKLFFTCCEYKILATTVISYSALESCDDPNLFLELVAKLVDDVCRENPQSVSWLVACLGPFIRAEATPQRVAAVAFFTYLLKQKATEQTVLVENLMEMILDVQNDESCAVRRIALQGLGYAAELSNVELISRHCNPILGVLMKSLDYNNIGNESSVILEGMLSFSKLLTTLDGYKFSTFQVTAAVRIKPLLGQEDVNLRRASFRLLGDLTHSLNAEANLEAFKEQIHGNLITLLLHLCDPDLNVVKACKYTLRKVGPYLDSPKVNSMIQEHLIDEANLHYADFARDLIKLMAEENQELLPLLVMTCLSYFKSQWIEIRSNAALLSGLLYSQLTADNKNKLSVDTVCDRLTKLLKDESEDVRMRAVEAISYLFLN